MNPTMNDYKQLNSASESIDNDMANYQYNIANKLSKALGNSESSLCNGKEGLKIIELFEPIVKENTSY